MQLGIASCLRYDPKALTYMVTMHRLKPMFFFSIDNNNLILTSYLSGILPRIAVFLVMRRNTENIEEKKKTDRRKTLKSEEKKRRRIQGKSNNNNIHF